MSTSNEYTYRLMKPGEEGDVCNLIVRVFNEFVAPVYSQEGIRTFLTMITPEDLKEKSLGQFVIVAESNGQLIGILAIRGGKHISLLFVKSEYQGQGIGKKLIRAGQDMCLEKAPGLEAITVSSSPNSISFYKSAGFKVTAGEANENGMLYITMAKYVGIKKGVVVLTRP